MSFANMDHAAYPAFRSTSLPSHTALALSTTPDSGVFRRDSDCMLSEGPITPPLSPTRSDDGESGIIVDAEPRYSGPGRQLEPSVPRPHLLEAASHGRRSHQQSDGMDVDPRPSASSPRPPQRHLEDEQSHLEKGSLKLTDFEVKGTLGTFFRMLFKWARLLYRYDRHGHLRARPPSSAAGLLFTICHKLFRLEGVAQNGDRATTPS